jgi:hypothetical protein
MFALGVVEKLDVIEHDAAGFFAGFVFLATDALAFEQVEEALDDSIIPAVAAYWVVLRLKLDLELRMRKLALNLKNSNGTVMHSITMRQLNT